VPESQEAKALVFLELDYRFEGCNHPTPAGNQKVAQGGLLRPPQEEENEKQYSFKINLQ
jgi:hypothetical protein